MLRTPTAVLMITGQIDGDEDHEDRRRAGIAESGERQRQPGERRHGAQDLEHRVKAAHRPDRLADQRAERHADDRRQAEADGDALQRDQHAPGQADILRAVVEEGIDDEVVGLGPDLRWAAAGWRRATSRRPARRRA